MKLLTVILNYKTADMTIDAAHSAVKASACIKGEWRIVIVDNDSQDGSAIKMQEAVKQKCQQEPNTGWENVSVVESGHNGGFGAGNNYAIRQALNSENPPEYCYILNSDAFPASNAIELLINYLDTHSDVGVAGSYIHGTDGIAHNTAFRFPTIYSEFEDAIKLGIISKLLKKYIVAMNIPDSTQEVDWLAGASIMFRGSMLNEVGLFDETFFLYFEETDLCKRIHNKKWKIVYVRESQVEHIGSVSTGMKEWERIPGYWLDSRKHYFCKNHGYLYATAATVVKCLGGMAWQFRLFLQRRPYSGPKYFLRDMLYHWFNKKQN